jgi:hypothetical protein
MVFVCTLASGARAAVPALPAPDAGVDAARVLEAARVPSCICEEERQALASYRDEVAAAKSLDEARDKATRPSRLARRAIGFASWMKRDTAEMDTIRARLQAYEDRVAKAETPSAAAAEFDGLVRVAGDVRVGGSGGCHYDATEVIAIVFGFLFFIIPGIILLFVFC